MKDKEQIVNECLTKLIAACALEKMKCVVAQNEDKWITIHPHGEDSEDYRRLKLKDGESPEDAMHRMGWYEKRKAKDEKKEKEKERKTGEKRINEYDKNFSEIKANFEKNRVLYMDVSKEIDKHRNAVIKLIGDITDKDKMNEITEKYIKEHPEVNNLNKKLEQADKGMQKADEDDKQYKLEIAKDILDTNIDTLTNEELEDLKLALEYTKNLYISFDVREKLSKFERDIKSLEYSKNRKELKEVAGVKKGKLMTFAEADNGKVNPHYKPYTEYSKNCQSCVVCYELRRRGFNVKTKPRTYEGYMQALATDATLAYIDPKTGKHPETNIMKVTTPDKAYSWLQDNINEGRYEFRMVWKSKYRGHIVTMFKENGNLVLYDPQTNQKITDKEEMKTEYLNKVRYRGSEDTKPFVLRVDNLDFNEKILSSIVEKA